MESLVKQTLSKGHDLSMSAYVINHQNLKIIINSIVNDKFQGN